MVTYNQMNLYCFFLHRRDPSHHIPIPSGPSGITDRFGDRYRQKIDELMQLTAELPRRLQLTSVSHSSEVGLAVAHLENSQWGLEMKKKCRAFEKAHRVKNRLTEALRKLRPHVPWA